MRREILKRGGRRRAARNLRGKTVCATRNFIKRKRRGCVQMRKTRAQKKRRPIRRVEFMQRSPRVRAEKFHRDARRLNTLSRRSARIVSARYRAAPYVSAAIYALRAVSCDIDRAAIVSCRDTAVVSVSRRVSLARCAGRAVKIVRAGRPVCASTAKF